MDVFAIDLDSGNAVVLHSGKDLLPLGHGAAGGHLLLESYRGFAPARRGMPLVSSAWGLRSSGVRP